jgi:hypothetical protein
MKSEHPNCPKCGAGHVASILYGLPEFSEELRHELDAKQIVLGGCVVEGDDPQWRCNECQHEWRSDT